MSTRRRCRPGFGALPQGRFCSLSRHASVEAPSRTHSFSLIGTLRNPCLIFSTKRTLLSAISAPSTSRRPSSRRQDGIATRRFGKNSHSRKAKSLSTASSTVVVSRNAQTTLTLPRLPAGRSRRCDRYQSAVRRHGRRRRLTCPKQSKNFPNTLDRERSCAKEVRLRLLTKN